MLAAIPLVCVYLSCSVCKCRKSVLILLSQEFLFNTASNLPSSVWLLHSVQEFFLRNACLCCLDLDALPCASLTARCCCRESLSQFVRRICELCGTTHGGQGWGRDTVRHPCLLSLFYIQLVDMSFQCRVTACSFFSSDRNMNLRDISHEVRSSNLSYGQISSNLHWFSLTLLESCTQAVNLPSTPFPQALDTSLLPSDVAIE